MTSIKQLFIWVIKPYNLTGFFPNLLHLIPRVICGFVLSVNFGSSKFGMPWTPDDRNLPLFTVIDWFVDDISAFGVPFSLAPAIFAWMAAASEAIGGVFLLLGLQTRLAAFFLMCTMLVAIFFQKWGEGLWNLLPAMGFLWISIYSLILGSGKIGLDHLIYRMLTTDRN